MLLPDLADALRERVNYVVDEHDDGTLAVTSLGSYADGGSVDVSLFLLEWQGAHPGVTIDILEQDEMN